MRRIVSILSMVVAIFAVQAASAQNLASLPDKITSGPFEAGHIQGIAVDQEQKYIYFSYTTMLIKADMQGNVVGSVTGLLGHLGCLDFNPEDGRVYGSLEYKNDAIGQGILKMKRMDQSLQNAFYIAIFDVDRITRLDMDAERDGIMTTVYLPTVLEDYLAKVETAEGEQLHRLGCSGIDGVSFGPKFGKTQGKNYLTVAYGIYSDRTRTDNDYQVLLQYDVKGWHKYERSLSQDKMHTQGPAKPAGQYFVKTGNTTYGVQNLEYDPTSGLWMMAVYKGVKPEWPNYSFFVSEGSARPVKQALDGVPYIKKGKVVPLADMGQRDSKTGIRGWDFGIGSTGMSALGGGYFYLSHSYNIEQGQGSNIYLYRFTGQESEPFVRVEK